jgi:2-polyprenyl-3-methyl-5-hydroxy-6-metoxy-1,4-benzoquinol methylase
MLKLETRSETQHAGRRSNIRSLLRVIRAAVVFVGVCLLWVILFVLFAPWLLLAQVVRLWRGQTRLTACEGGAIAERSTPDTDVPLIFDRRSDVSKLYGCNTRNVRYRWTIFGRRLEELQREFDRPRVLDFGAGSLRDSYELASRGFEVVSFDLSERILRRYFDSYDWTVAGDAPKLLAGSLEDLQNDVAPESLQVVLAFDVIEHLEDPSSYVQTLSRLLCERGFLFTIVPNKRSLFERYFKRSLTHQRKRGISPEPGVPHIQFKSPEEWNQFFQTNGFRIVDHDMAIGHFVNDWWNGLLSIPLRAFVYPVLEVASYHFGPNMDSGRIERALCPSWLMERVNDLDILLKEVLKSRFGWNLIVAQKAIPSTLATLPE